jgi:hypothetical protein
MYPAAEVDEGNRAPALRAPSVHWKRDWVVQLDLLRSVVRRDVKAAQGVRIVVVERR